MDLTPAGNNKLAFTTKEPIGAVVAISAFNHPLNLIVHQVAPAVAAGNPVIVKPADDTPLSCKLFVDILHEAGLPPGWAQCICCEVSLAQKLVTDERVAFFSFIGSAAVGWKLRSLLAPGTRVALEHGGVAPVIVGPSADRDQLVPSLVKGGFYHSGQVCVSVQRVFSYGASARTLAEAIADHASNLIVGNATAAETQCGPLIRNREVDRVEAWVEEAVSAGAEVSVAARGCRTPVTHPRSSSIRQKIAASHARRSLGLSFLFMRNRIWMIRLRRPIAFPMPSKHLCSQMTIPRS